VSCIGRNTSGVVAFDFGANAGGRPLWSRSLARSSRYRRLNAYFSRHSDVAVRESEQAVKLLLAELRTREEQDRALDSVRFKCDVLNALLDAVAAIR
jgi:pyrroloquinoline quinone (PQQ) biosynthesis protein C